MDAYPRGFDGVFARLLNGEFGDATDANAAMEPLKADIRQMDEKLVALKKRVVAAAAAERTTLQALQQRLLVTLGVAVLLVGGLLGAIAWALVRIITSPLQRANPALERLAASDLLFKGLAQSSGDTEPLLQAWRLRVKAAQPL